MPLLFDNAKIQNKFEKCKPSGVFNITLTSTLIWFFCLISAFLVIGVVLLRQKSEREGERKHTMLYSMLSSHHSSILI